MRFSLVLSIVTICLFISANSFSLMGEWILSTQHLQFATNLTQTNISFTFSQQPNQQNTISNQLVISACRTMFYTFTYRENSIVPIFIKFGNNTRDCKTEEVNEIRRKMESVFYFSIVDSRLILTYPSKQVAFTLYKNVPLIAGVKGNWSVFQMNGKKSDNEKIEIKEDRILLCKGKIILQYKVQVGNTITINQVSNSGDCPQLDSLSKALQSSKYYSLDNSQLQLFNQNIQPLIKLSPTPYQLPFTPIPKQTLHNKWYIHSINNTQLNQQTEPIFYYYFLIITPERFRFYGGCNVQYSFYDFVNGYQVRHRDTVYVTKPTCRYVNQDTLVLNSLFDRGRYLSFDQKTGILSFFDDQKNNVIEFTTIMPDTRDILPSFN